MMWEIEVAMPAAIAFAAVISVASAYGAWRATIKTLKHRQFDTAAARLKSVGTPGNWSYVTRTAAIATLAKLAKDHPKDFDEPVMRAFEAFLSFPPRYGQHSENERQVDYTSRDTVAIVETINNRPKGWRRWWKYWCWQEAYLISLPPNRPFRVTQDGKVEKNSDYDDPGESTSRQTRMTRTTSFSS